MGIKYAAFLFSTILISFLGITQLAGGAETAHDLLSYKTYNTLETTKTDFSESPPQAAYETASSLSALSPIIMSAAGTSPNNGNPLAGAGNRLEVDIADIGYGIAFVFLALAFFLLKPFIPTKKIFGKIKEKFSKSD